MYKFRTMLRLVAAFTMLQLASTVASRESEAAFEHFVPFLFEGLLLCVLIVNAIRSVVTHVHGATVAVGQSAGGWPARERKR